MKLLLDMGNSRIKWAVWDGGWQSEGHAVLGEEPEAGWLAGLPVRESIWLASVAKPERTEAVANALREASGREVNIVTTPAKACGVRCAYAEPQRLGVDRWLAVVAAFRKSKGPAVVFDAGSALTVDAVTPAGEHLGGLIMPGVDMMRRALYRETGRIPDEGEAAFVADTGLLAKDTRAAVNGGALQAATAFVRHVAAELGRELGPDTEFWLTGGDAGRLRVFLPEYFRQDARLVMEGLLAMAEELECAAS